MVPFGFYHSLMAVCMGRKPVRDHIPVTPIFPYVTCFMLIKVNFGHLKQNKSYLNLQMFIALLNVPILGLQKTSAPATM